MAVGGVNMSCLMTGLRSGVARILFVAALIVGMSCQSAAGAAPAESDTASADTRAEGALPPASAAVLLFGLLGVATAVTAFSVHLACEWSELSLETESEPPPPKPLHTAHPPVLSPNI